MYEAIIITKILIQFLKPKTHRGISAIVFYYFPFPRYERELRTT